jgi:hypothetical protein
MPPTPELFSHMTSLAMEVASTISGIPFMAGGLAAAAIAAYLLTRRRRCIAGHATHIHGMADVSPKPLFIEEENGEDPVAPFAEVNAAAQAAPGATPTPAVLAIHPLLVALPLDEGVALIAEEWHMEQNQPSELCMHWYEQALAGLEAGFPDAVRGFFSRSKSVLTLAFIRAKQLITLPK